MTCICERPPRSSRKAAPCPWTATRTCCPVGIQRTASSPAPPAEDSGRLHGIGLTSSFFLRDVQLMSIAPVSKNRTPSYNRDSFLSAPHSWEEESAH
ncbi:hypothetical protein C4K40_4903 [Pseudomonas sp. CMR5c]|nr:hypothetical protein C4K40_4903 [Pseudomonas sp. CMR5c]